MAFTVCKILHFDYFQVGFKLCANTVRIDSSLHVQCISVSKTTLTSK